MTSLSPRRRRMQILAVLGLAVAVFAAFTVAPASAGTHSHVASAWCGDATGFSSLDRLAVSSAAARGDVMRERKVGPVQQVHTSAPASGSRVSRTGFRVTVPTWVHVVSDGAIGNVSDRAIRGQIRVLDMTYGGFEGGVATGFDFELVGVTRTNNATWHYASDFESESAMKQALHTGGPETLNLYLTTAGPYLGWAYYPSIVDDTTNAYLDGVVVDWESMLGTSDTYAGRYDRGETATHEVGHWLNLAHTFDGKCGREGDGVADTPSERTPTSGCPADKDTCPAPGLDPIHNYMDYSYDTCYTEFTADQSARMQDAWAFWRAS
jgi:Pregnancy-associated plasma protein-A